MYSMYMIGMDQEIPWYERATLLFVLPYLSISI